MPLPDQLTEEDREFLEERAPYYHRACPCDDCIEFRDLLGLEEGAQVDLEDEFGLSTDITRDTDDGSDEPCRVCGSRNAIYSLNTGGMACDECWNKAPIIYCQGCEKYKFAAEDCDWYDGANSGAKGYCEECVTSGVIETAKCDECNEVKIPDREGDLEITRGGLEVCHDCLTQSYVLCDECNDWIFAEIFNTEDGISNPRLGTICGDCIDEDYETCPDCGHMRNQETFEGCDCPADRIWHYTYTPPNLQFFTGKMEKDHGKYVRDRRANKNNKATFARPYFGVEIEVECVEGEREDGSMYLHDENFLFCKRDASIDYGFEIVSHPFTFMWLREHEDTWKRIFRDLKGMGFESYHTNTCGMHVHISKNSFDRVTLYNYLQLIYDNEDFAISVSERTIERFDRWSGVKEEKERGKLSEKARSKDRNLVPHHDCAVSVQKNKTVETRIFQGTLEMDRFLKNIEFCKAAHDYALNTSIKGVSVPGFKDFVNKHQKTFPNLHHFLDN